MRTQVWINGYGEFETRGLNQYPRLLAARPNRALNFAQGVNYRREAMLPHVTRTPREGPFKSRNPISKTDWKRDPSAKRKVPIHKFAVGKIRLVHNSLVKTIWLFSKTNRVSP